MGRRVLGRTGLEVSPICIGTWQLAGPVTFDGKPDGHPDPGKENVLRLIRELGARGINAIDAAEQYGDGEAERRVGEAIRGERDRWVISTKFGYRVGPGQRRIDDASPPTILPSLEGSLRRLGTDWIDVYLYHCRPDPADLAEAAEILGRARAEGKVRAIGISTADVEMARALEAHGLLDVVQFPSNLLEPADALLGFARGCGAGVQLRGVMAQGRLSGKYFGGAPVFGADDTRSRWAAGERFERFGALARWLPEGMTMAQFAVRWALDQPGVHTVCLGAKTLGDYEVALAAAGMGPLPAEAVAGMRGDLAAL
jgi:aryl-alcohol dehydrogenase-like predicted oxidoreductase